MATKAKAKKSAAKKLVRKTAKLEMGDASVAFKVRQAVVKKPGITFEDACKTAGVEAIPGKHAHNVWQHAHHVLQMFEAQYGNR